MKSITHWQFVFVVVLLTSCSEATQLVTPMLRTQTPIDPTSIPTIINYPTQTQSPCPPRLDTKIPEPDIPENYKGKVFHLNYPDGLKLEFEGSVSGDSQQVTNYQLAFVINQNTGQKLFWLERELCTDNQRQTFYEITDSLALTINVEKQEVVSPGSCWLNGVFDPNIVAVGDLLPYSEKLQNISKAWRANTQTEKIEELPTSGIECNRYSGISGP